MTKKADSFDMDKNKSKYKNTNYDRIRLSTNEELEKILDDIYTKGFVDGKANQEYSDLCIGEWFQELLSE